MNIAFVVDPFFRQNRIFSTDDPVANRDGCLEPFICLRERLAQQGVRLETADLMPIARANAVLFLNAPQRHDPAWQEAARRGIPIHILAMESEYIHAPNADWTLLRQCESVFTYRDDLVDNCRFFPIRYGQRLRPPPLTRQCAPGFACMISGNKWSKHPSELYSARLRVIEWYEAHAREAFRLYGQGWDIPTPRNLLAKISRRLPGLREWCMPRYRVWQGAVANKQETISRFRFCYCFENFSGPEGWITEKIFDAMYAGAVPVYWGPKNVQDHIPRGCFVDASQFSSVATLHAHLAAMSELECDGIRDACREFLASQAAEEFSIETFVATVAGRLLAPVQRESKIGS